MQRAADCFANVLMICQRKAGLSKSVSFVICLFIVSISYTPSLTTDHFSSVYILHVNNNYDNNNIINSIFSVNGNNLHVSQTSKRKGNKKKIFLHLKYF